MTTFDPQETLKDLRERTYDMPDGDAKIELLEQAVRLADTVGDLETAFDVRDDLVNAASVWGRPEIELVAFSWCLAQFDADPERFAYWEHSLMWSYKRVLMSMMGFPEISLPRIEAAFADFRSRLERSNQPLGTYYEYRLRLALHRSDPLEAEAAHKEFRHFNRASDLDCRACQLQSEVNYQGFLGDDAATLQAAAPLLVRYAPSCNRVPNATHAKLLLPLLRLGKIKDAAKHHRDYRKLMKDEGSVAFIAQHLEFLGYLGDLTAALNLLEKHLPWAYRTRDLNGRYVFLRATLPLFARLRSSGENTLKLRLDCDFSYFQKNGEYGLDTLENQIRTDLLEVAAKFDARNGNNSFSSRIEPDRELLERPAQLLPQEKPKAKKPSNSLKG